MENSVQQQPTPGHNVLQEQLQEYSKQLMEQQQQQDNQDHYQSNSAEESS